MRLALASSLLFAQSAFAATAISVESLVSTVIYLVVIGLIFWLIWWFLSYVALPEPFNKVLRVIVAVLALLVVVNFLLALVGYPILTLK